MASPFTGVLKHSYIGSASRRCFASKRKRSNKNLLPKSVEVKSLFEAQTDKENSECKGTSPKSYRAFLDLRQGQASRSILVRVHRTDLLNVCNSLQCIGDIKKAYMLPTDKNDVIVEFKHQDTVDKVLQHASYFKNGHQIPIRSRLIYYMNSYQKHSPANFIKPKVVEVKELTTEDYLGCRDLCSQMQALHETRQLSDLGSRLRFLTCSMVDDLVRTSWPFCRIHPFGSSSNGFGWEGCDLDMMMTVTPPASKPNANSKFRFLTKHGLESDNERVFGQHCLDVVGEMIRGFMPFAYHVHKVLSARVPIVKFHHGFTDLDCDVSYFNLSGTKMSELMYLLGELDSRVRVLMTTIKQWAKSCGLTRSHPGPWPTNFTLLAMLIFFLQTRSPPVLPSLKHLQALAGPDDHFIIDDIDYAFVTDVSKVNKSENTQSLAELLKEFFHFYAHMDFTRHGISLIEGSTFTKQSSDPMHIENPMEIGHNISRNMNATYVAKLQEVMMKALQCLDSKAEPNGSEWWGLLCLFHHSSTSASSTAFSVANLLDSEQQLQDQTEEHSPAEGVDVDDKLMLAEQQERKLDTTR